MRTGLHVSGAGGSGVLVARKADGSWSPPSGILVHTAAIGFLIGVDIYDCVVVINKREALEAFTRVRVTIGGEISAVAGPIGVGGIVDTEVHKRQAPLYTYMKSRGFYAGVQADGTIVIERTDENARFYGERISCTQILAGNVKNIPESTRVLLEVCKAADGQHHNTGVMDNLQGQPTPADLDIQEPSRLPTQQEQTMYGFYGDDKIGNKAYPPQTSQQTSTSYPPQTSQQSGTAYPPQTSQQSGTAYPPQTNQQTGTVYYTTPQTSNTSHYPNQPTHVPVDYQYPPPPPGGPPPSGDEPPPYFPPPPSGPPPSQNPR